MNAHVLFGPHVHCPLAQVPLQVVFAAQVTWQGGAAHENAQLLPLPQTQVPFAHAPEHIALSPSHVA